MKSLCKVVLVLVLVFTVALVAFGAPAKQSQTVLNIGVNTGVSTLNPALSGGGDPIVVFTELAYDPLIYRMPDGSLTSCLAESWRYVGTENKIFEFTLRAGVKFSDGSLLTAEGVKKHLEYYGSAGGPFADRIKDFSTIEVTGPLSVRLTLNRPNPELPFLFSQRQVTGGIISPKGIANPQLLGTTTAGAGQYMIDTNETVTNQKYTYVPNPNYWNPKAIHWQKIVVKVIADPNTMLSALVSGQVDYAFGSPLTAAAAAKAGFEVQTQPYTICQVHILDRNGTIVPALADVRVRQAMNYAIDRKAVAAVLYGDNGIPNWQSSLPGADSWSDTLVNYYPYDPEKAKKLLAEAGYANGVTIPMIAYNLQPGETDAAAAIVSEWSKVGITTPITIPVSFGDFAAKYKQMPTMMFFYGVLPMYIMGSQWFGSGFANPFRVNDKDIDDYYAKACAEPDTAKRNALWVQLQKRMLDLAWMVPFAGQSKIVYVRPGLKGVDLGPMNMDPHPIRFSAQ